MQNLNWLSVAVPIAVLLAGLSSCKTEPPNSRATTTIEADPTVAGAGSSPTTTAPSGVPQTATGATGSGRDDRLGPPGSGRPATAVLEPGDCYNETMIDGDKPTRETTVVGCLVPHDGEVFARQELVAAPGVSFPGDREVERAAMRICLPRFEVFVGRPFATSSLRVSLLRPAASSWIAGDRVVVCSVYDAALEPLSGSMLGSKR